MKSRAALLLVLITGCTFSSAHQITSVTVDEAWLRNQTLSVAVIDIYTNDNPIDPAFLQLNLAQALRNLGYGNARSQAFGRIHQPWKTEDAAGIAKRNGHDAVLVCAMHHEEGLLNASIRVIDADENVRYEVRVELPANGMTGEDLISELLRPLERIL